ncbi:MAG: minor capsid protein [Clostridia bacterium]|nr:minor capsid protein [Clostridia bacterium]
MARKPVGYWEKRSTELMLLQEKNTENSIRQLIQIYNKATKNINQEISNIFRNYSKGTELDRDTLLKLLNTRETETHYNNLLKVINNNITDDGIKKKLLAKYNAPAYAYRISRYQALQDNIDIELSKMANFEQNIDKQRYVDTIKDVYYHNIYDVQKKLGYSFSFSHVDTKTIGLMLKDKWIDNANFSERIWNNKERLNNYLKINFTADTLTGKSIQRIASELSEALDVGLFNATRLIRTEVNHFANESEMLSYEELGIEKYQFIATLDKRTCVHCGRMDGRIFNLKDKKAGVNYPPLHPNDRCTTVAVFDDDIKDDLKRRARDENGKPILISQNINYEKWKEKYIENEPVLQNELKEDKINKKILKSWKKFKNIDEAKEYVYNNYKDSDIDKIKNVESLNVTFETLDKLQKQYPLNQEIFVRNKTLTKAAANGNYQGININTAHFNKANSKALYEDNYINNVNQEIKELEKYLGDNRYKQRPIENGIKQLEEQKKYRCYTVSSSYADLESLKATITHEYGHVVADQYFGQINKVKANSNFEYFESNECYQKCMNVSKVYYQALRNADIYNISYYASTNEQEFFAECFAKKQMNEKLPDYIDEMIERVLKIGK